MKNSVKVHPHLKSFIHSVVISELTGIEGSKKYKWKELLMKEVQNNILERLDEITTQGDLEKVTTEEAQKLRQDFTKTLELVGQTLKQLPIEVLRPAITHR